MIIQSKTYGKATLQFILNRVDYHLSVFLKNFTTRHVCLPLILLFYVNITLFKIFTPAKMIS